MRPMPASGLSASSSAGPTTASSSIAATCRRCWTPVPTPRWLASCATSTGFCTSAATPSPSGSPSRGRVASPRLPTSYGLRRSIASSRSLRTWWRRFRSTLSASTRRAWSSPVSSRPSPAKAEDPSSTPPTATMTWRDRLLLSWPTFVARCRWCLSAMRSPSNCRTAPTGFVSPPFRTATF